ncbi:MAG: hypothetical protein NVS2B17_01570 [Candidatus Velthaea sp.]
MPSLGGHVLVERNRLHRLIDQIGDTRVLFLCAPFGTGKTTLARQLVARSGGAGVIIAATPLRTLDDMRDELHASTGFGTVIIDDADTLPQPVLDYVLSAVEAESLHRKYCLTGRRRSILRVHTFVARGAGALLDETALAFDVREVRTLAASAGVVIDDDLAAQLVNQTDGWALAVEWILREAALMQRGGRIAYEAWHAAHGRLFLEVVEDAHAADRDLFAEFTAALGTDPAALAERYANFEAAGFPIVRSGGMMRPYRLLMALHLAAPSIEDRRATPRVPNADPMMTVSALGRFRCSIGDSVLSFQRRRDHNILAFVALAPDMRAGREQLIAAFWPTANRALATQSLRTTLSRIRRSIAAIVGPTRVDRYFESSGDVRLRAETVTVDVRRFMDMVQRGHLEDARGARESARRHFGDAERLYDGLLLASECVEPAFSERIAEIDKIYEDMLLRLVQMLYNDHKSQLAESYAAKLMARSRTGTLHGQMLHRFAAAVRA